MLLALASLLATSGGASAATVGISDQQAASFESPLYSPLKLKAARYITPYDVMSDQTELDKLDRWITAARAARQRVLISFEHSRIAGKERKAPSTSLYKRELRKFKAEYGSQVESISPWNEVNVCQKGGRTEGQPTAICKVKKGGPKRAAGYYKVARSVFKGKKIVGLDILDGTNVGGAVSYIRAFKKYAKPMPTIWGLHNYSDTNRGSTKRTSAMIRAIGSSRAQIWLTETGGQLKLRDRWYGGSERAAESRAAKALGCMFSMPKRMKQIKRLYIYQFHGARPDEEFDAGLVDYKLEKKRKGYDVVKKRKARTCKA